MNFERPDSPEFMEDEEEETPVFEIAEEDVNYDDVIQQSIRELQEKPAKKRQTPKPKIPPGESAPQAEEPAPDGDVYPEIVLEGAPAAPVEHDQQEEELLAQIPISLRPAVSKLYQRSKKDLVLDLLHLQQFIQVKQQRLVDAEEELKQQQKQTERLSADLSRVSSEFDAYRQRVLRQQEDFFARANRELILKLLPVLDHADLAAASSQQPGQGQGSVFDGFLLIFNELKQVLKLQGLEEIPAAGVKFDPRIHEAMMIEVSADVPDNWVAKELRAGYMLNGKLLRAALVTVAKSPKPIPRAVEPEPVQDQTAGDPLPQLPEEPVSSNEPTPENPPVE